MNKALEVAQQNVATEMAAFPWTPQDPLEAAAEADAEAAGIYMGRRRDAIVIQEHLAHAKHVTKEGGVRTYTDITSVTSDRPKPRTRCLVLGHQAIVSAGIPAIITDSRSEHGGYIATLVLVPSEH